MLYFLFYFFAGILFSGLGPSPTESKGMTESLDYFADTAVLIHGCHLKTEDWDSIVFGNEQQQGRVPVGVEEAIKSHAKLIYWGSGASQNAEGIKEGMYTYFQAMGPSLASLAKYVGENPETLAAYLKQVSFLDSKAQNTVDEISEAIALCKERGIKKLFLISSPTHIARCMQEACKIKAGEGGNLKIYSRASDTCYACSTPGDVVIFEPPHRSEWLSIAYNKVAKEMVAVMKDPSCAHEFYQELEQLLKKYNKSF